MTNTHDAPPSISDVMAAKAAVEESLGKFNIAEDTLREATIDSSVKIQLLTSMVETVCRKPIRTIADARFKAALARSTDCDEDVDVIGELVDLKPKFWQTGLLKLCERARAAVGDREAEEAILAELRAGAGPEFRPLRSAH